MPAEIRHPVLDEAADYLRTVNTAFLTPESRDAAMAEFWAGLKPTWTGPGARSTAASRWAACVRPVEEPLPWLVADGRWVKQTERYDKLWLRVLDVPAALTGRAYQAAGRVVLDVVDPAGYAAGRSALDASPAGATCARTTEPADLTLPVTALGSAYLGGHRLGTLAAAGLVTEHASGALATADRLLVADRAPWCTLHF